jgi:hypothetical protein
VGIRARTARNKSVHFDPLLDAGILHFPAIPFLTTGSPRFQTTFSQHPLLDRCISSTLLWNSMGRQRRGSQRRRIVVSFCASSIHIKKLICFSCGASFLPRTVFWRHVVWIISKLLDLFQFVLLPVHMNFFRLEARTESI